MSGAIRCNIVVLVHLHIVLPCSHRSPNDNQRDREQQTLLKSISSHKESNWSVESSYQKGIYFLVPHVDFSCVCCCQSRWLSRVNRCGVVEGWLVGRLGLTALWDNIAVYIGPSPRERVKEARKDRWEKICPNHPHPHLLQVQQALVLLLSKPAGRPGTGSLLSTIAPPTTPCCRRKRTYVHSCLPPLITNPFRKWNAYIFDFAKLSEACRLYRPPAFLDINAPRGVYSILRER